MKEILFVVILIVCYFVGRAVPLFYEKWAWRKDGPRWKKCIEWEAKNGYWVENN